MLESVRSTATVNTDFSILLAQCLDILRTVLSLFNVLAGLAKSLKK